MRIDTRKSSGNLPAGKAGADLERAFADLQRDQASRAKWRRRKNRTSQWGTAEIVKGLLLLGGLALLGLLGDGLRRESGEFSATFATLSGAVEVCPAGAEWRAAEAKMELKDGDLVRTLAGATAILSFSDGSGVTLDPGTTFEVRQLGYARSGARNRSFVVRQGSVLARVGTMFGGEVGSEATVCTPTAVAAVRGTAFRVAYDELSGGSSLEVVEGTVRYATPTAVVEASQGSAARAAGYAVGDIERLSGTQQRQLGAARDALLPLEQPTPFVVRVERRLLSIGDPVLQLIGLAPGAWGYDSIDSARRAACIEALRRLRTHLESAPEVPVVLNPVTLAELSLNEKELTRLQSGWLNGMFDQYEGLGQDGYRVVARARDRRHTAFQMTNADLHETTYQPE